MHKTLFAMMFLFSASLLHAEDSKIYTPEPLDPAVEDFVLKSTGLLDARGAAKLARPAMLDLTEDNPILRNFWIGSQALTEAKGDLKFRLESQLKDQKPFSLTLSFDDEYAIVKHSNPKSSESKGGYKIPFDESKGKKFFLEGSGRRSLVAVVPPKINPQLRAIALCFRDVAADASPYEVPLLLDTKYRITEFEFIPEIWARGKFNSGVREGYARADIKVGQAAGSTHPTSDEASMINPSVSVGYASKFHPLGYGVPIDSLKTFATGGESRLELKTAGGQSRIKLHKADYFIKHLSGNGPDQVVFVGIIHPVEQGSCELVVQRRYIVDRLSGSIESVKDELMQDVPGAEPKK